MPIHATTHQFRIFMVSWTAGHFLHFPQPQEVYTMKVTQAVDFHLQYHRANSKKILQKPVSSSFPPSLPDLVVVI